MSRFWPSCISGTSHAPCREVPSALLPACSAVSPAYKNFSCSPSFFSSSFLFSFLVFRLVHQFKSLLPACSAVSPAYKNFSCSPSFFSSSFLFSFLVFRLVHQSKSQVSSQVRSRLLNQLGSSSALPLPRHIRCLDFISTSCRASSRS